MHGVLSCKTPSLGTGPEVGTGGTTRASRRQRLTRSAERSRGAALCKVAHVDVECSHCTSVLKASRSASLHLHNMKREISSLTSVIAKRGIVRVGTGDVFGTNGSTWIGHEADLAPVSIDMFAAISAVLRRRNLLHHEERFDGAVLKDIDSRVDSVVIGLKGLGDLNSPFLHRLFRPLGIIEDSRQLLPFATSTSLMSLICIAHEPRPHNSSESEAPVAARLPMPLPQAERSSLRGCAGGALTA